METREDKSPRQILVEEAVLSSSTVQNPTGRKSPGIPCEKETAKADHEDLRRKEPPCPGRRPEMGQSSDPGGP
ncbi:hypothetical protein DUI87_26543 [Hirundo rustica rustica]|uniref:Uncharacterized protein n=1 Tax=Hirundo rustica rustica TaxID=333673 RepID=A0A3M0J7R8_HIRRU|nr:hypothetical protein DUI87_26543 [Hirundo rustica rustica]